MENQVDDYFAALDRLRANSPRVVPKGTRISNDAVSLEAGRKKGSIKKSRAQFAALIVAIEAARKHLDQGRSSEGDELVRLKEKIMQLRQELEAALAREFSLVVEMREVRSQLSMEHSGRVATIRKQK